jgi:SRSO17 transposase
LYRRYEAATRWEEFVHQHFPDREIPKRKKERAQFHKAIDPVLLQDPAFQALHQQFRTKIELAAELVEAALAHKLPFSVVLFDSWYLSGLTTSRTTVARQRLTTSRTVLKTSKPKLFLAHAVSQKETTWTTKMNFAAGVRQSVYG